MLLLYPKIRIEVKNNRVYSSQKKLRSALKGIRSRYPDLASEGLFAALFFHYAYRGLFPGSPLPTPPEQESSVREILDTIPGDIFNTGTKNIPAEAIATLFSECNLLNPFTLGYAYQILSVPGQMKNKGVIYTPEHTAQDICRKAFQLFYSQNTAHHPGILDPACGTGIFLIAALRELWSDWRSDTPFHQCIARLQNHFFGIDQDPTACALARSILSIELTRLENVSGHIDDGRRADISKLFKNQILCGNSLISDTDCESPAVHGGRCWGELFKTVFEDGGFDIILGNPPYGLSREDRLSPEENELLKTRYQRFRTGKVNKYLLFMARAYEWCRQNGTVAFIVPNSWLGIRNATALRKILLETGSLEEIVYYRYPVFDLPSVEAVSVFICKDAARGSFKLRKLDEAGTEDLVTMDTNTCLEQDEAEIPLYWSDEVAEAFHTIRRHSTPLNVPGSLFSPAIALQAYAQGKGNPKQTKEMVRSHCYHSFEKLSETYYPYYEGRDVQRFSLLQERSYLNYGPWLAEPQLLERFTGPRILIREILNPPPFCISASYLERPGLYNKSVLHILPQNGAGSLEMKALLAILNSRFASAYIRLRGKKSQRKLFPKLVSQDLKRFPLPESFHTFKADLAHAANALFSESTPEPDCSAQHQLDELVYQAYGLKGEDRLTIESSLTKAIP